MTRLEMLSEQAFVIHGALTQEMCDAYIEGAEARGFADAPVTTPHGPVMMPDVRDNTRVMYDDIDEAYRLWELLEPHVPEHWLERTKQGIRWRAYGLNERLRYYRYDPSQQFRLHRDGHFARGAGDRSMMTVLFYLNGGFEGGETMVRVGYEDFWVEPEAGMVLCFEHRLLHEGVRVERGRKYVLRTDLMYEALDDG